MKCGARASLVGNSGEFAAPPTGASESSFAIAGISKDWRIRHHFLNSALCSCVWITLPDSSYISDGSISDEDYRKRLQDKFGKRWTIKVLVQPRKSESDTVPATLTNELVEVINTEGRRRRHRKTIKIVRHRAVPGGNTTGVERDTPVDLPRFRFARADEFEKSWHLALWAPKDPDGPSVLINTDSPILQEVVEYHQAQYPDIYAEEVSNTIRHVFGEVATCKVAHSQKLRQKVTEEELDHDYRNEAALTIALMGLMAEESVIAQRLGKLGRKKVATALTDGA